MFESLISVMVKWDWGAIRNNRQGSVKSYDIWFSCSISFLIRLLRVKTQSWKQFMIYSLCNKYIANNTKIHGENNGNPTSAHTFFLHNHTTNLNPQTCFPSKVANFASDSLLAFSEVWGLLIALLRRWVSVSSPKVPNLRFQTSNHISDMICVVVHPAYSFVA